jgi:eukaryotic-like serine/threonine-protein kinase
MNTSKQQIDAIFFTALKLNETRLREIFLDRACDGDGELRTAVDRLLASTKDSEGLFENPSSLFEVSAEDVQEAARENIFQESCLVEECIGTRIGRYRLLERIGEGGCGVVYKAEQEQPVRRSVALKIIKLGMNTRRIIARFEAEQQALALMDHPNIAHALDAGATESGRPYFVMELVDGVKITDFCDQHNLSVEQRLKLFVEVCFAIQHAHQKGIIHRDIKPSNVLVTSVDGKPVPRVIDFGIAKATQGSLGETTHFSVQEQLLGTPAYMSPEQAASGGLAVDTRSDIYSLGVLLYELLTNRTPMDATDLAHSQVDVFRRKLRENDPLCPSARLHGLSETELTEVARHRLTNPPQLISRIKGDLDWVVMKALEKELDRRYATANGLAAEVGRYLNNEPISARPPSRVYRLQKLVRRNKVVFGAGFIVAIVLVAGLLVSTISFLREKDARQEQTRLRQLAEEARANETRVLTQSQARERLARAAVFLSQQKMEEADALLANTPFDSVPPSIEASSVLRAIGEWNASYGRWKQATDCFAALMQANQLMPPLQIAQSSDLLLPGPALLESGGVRGYERFRQEILNRYGGCATNPIAAEHIIKICLLLPAGGDVLQRLQPYSQTVVTSLNDGGNGRFLAWRAVALALMNYRQNDFTQALEWGQKCLKYPDVNSAALATVHCLMAMSSQRLGQTEAARSELAQARKLAKDGEVKSGMLKDFQDGFWYDWIVVKHLLLEASSMTPNTAKDSPAAAGF